jgi:hypothetical protein
MRLVPLEKGSRELVCPFLPFEEMQKKEQILTDTGAIDTFLLVLSTSRTVSNQLLLYINYPA